MSTGPSPPAPAPALETLPRGESQWTIIYREFRKRRLAVLSYVVLVIVAATAIFAPFLANDRPIAYRGYNRGEFERARSVVRALLGQLIEPPVDERGEPRSIDRDDVRRSIVDRLSAMQRELAPEPAIQVAEVLSEFQRTADDDAKALRALQTRVSGYSARTMPFAAGWRFPVFAALDGIDAGFMVLAVLYLSSPVWRLGLRRLYGRTHPAVTRWTIGVLVLGPLLTGGLWHLSVPRTHDLSRYKEGVLANADPQQVARAQVVYEQVLWPPIPYGLDENRISDRKLPPVWWPNQERVHEGRDSAPTLSGLPASPPHWMGTDNLGRDITCRMIWGGRVSLAVGVVAVSIYVAIGILIGALAGYFRGWVDLVISRVIEVVICFPSFFLILAIVAFVGPSMLVIMVVIGLTSWTGVARLVRAEFLRLANQDFVQAGRALGYSAPRLIFRHILPNAMAPVLVSATFGVAGAILIESALSFLGLGITVPKPSWGGILSDGRDAIFSAQWIIFFPGLAIFLTITCYNLVGEAFRDAADPRLRGSR